nr:hypothetical protein [uncultured Porphyromonas sp.]
MNKVKKLIGACSMFLKKALKRGHTAQDEEAIDKMKKHFGAFYMFIEQALDRHGYTEQESEGYTCCFFKPFAYGRLCFAFSISREGVIEVKPPQVVYLAVERVLQELDYPDKEPKSIARGTCSAELSTELIEAQRAMKADPTVDTARLLGLETFKYIEEELDDFEEEYAIPGNRIEELELSDFWAMEFNGSPIEGIFRGLIFYRLADPELLDERLEQSDALLENRDLVPDDAWRVSYQELKERLLTLDEVYD